MVDGAVMVDAMITLVKIRFYLFFFPLFYNEAVLFICNTHLAGWVCNDDNLILS